MADIGGSMADKAKQDFLLSMYDKSPLMRPEAQYFRRLPADSPEGSYAMLLSALDRELERGREEETESRSWMS